ncbi:MAG: hypothetical protein CFH22_00373 [Alphaproteobacteria bacterium MarineAlpha5_Bin12]|nr:MAG: hypothetical protein CFH22_00373 [Alphaproteobacteria bacterium MarineAlpha5_Bin12]|tara:strand:- start:4082 stop:4876 length:795 start_codon:yes stop_codon:yes gene_type:complete
MIKYIFLSFFVYFLIGLGLYLSQRKLTFNKSGKPGKPYEYGLQNVNEVFLNVSDNIKLLNWLAEPKPNKPLIIYFHGNSFDIGERAYRIKEYIDEGYGVLLHAYRGFSGNSGKPSEDIIYSDSKILIKWIMKKLSINEKNIILYGESLGTGVAVHLAQNKNYMGVVLEAPFTSISEIAQKMYPIYPVKYLIWDKFDNLSKINNILSPLLILHGKKDEVVPFEMGKKIFEQYNQKKKKVFIDEAMHNNLYEYGIAKEVINFIKNI